MPKNKKEDTSESDSASRSESETEEKEPPSKKQKKAPAAKPSKSSKTSTKKPDEDNESQWNLNADTFVTVREFRGKLYVDIRKFYNDANGELKPTKKGISLTASDYQKLKSLIGDIDEGLKKF